MTRDTAVFVEAVPMCVTRNGGMRSEREGRGKEADDASDGERVVLGAGKERSDMWLLKFRAGEGIMI